MKKDLVIAFGVCALVLSLAVSLPRLVNVYDLHRLNSVDQSALLLACRSLITQYSTMDPKTKGITIPPEKYPNELRAIRPAMVRVSTNHVYIVLRAGFGRFAVFAFAEGCPQYGKQTSTDGLSYTYNPGREYQGMMEAEKPQQPDRAATQDPAPGAGP